MKREFFYLLTSALLCAGSMEATAEDGISYVPVKAYGYRYSVEALLDGKLKANLIIDTGSTYTIISRSIASKLEILDRSKAPSVPVASAGGLKFLRLVTLESVTVGGHSANIVEAALSPRLEPGVDGFLGMSFLNDFSFAIDGPQKRLVLKPAYDSGRLYGGKNKIWWSQKFARYKKIVAKYKHYQDELKKGVPPIIAQDLKDNNTLTNKKIGLIVRYYKGLLARFEHRAKVFSIPFSWQNEQ